MAAVPGGLAALCCTAFALAAWEPMDAKQCTACRHARPKHLAADPAFGHLLFNTHRPLLVYAAQDLEQPRPAGTGIFTLTI